MDELLEKLESAQRSSELIFEWVEKVKLAARAQADDPTLWGLDKERPPSRAEAHIIQSLRWLHEVIETGDETALRSIVKQSADL